MVLQGAQETLDELINSFRDRYIFLSSKKSFLSFVSGEWSETMGLLEECGLDFYGKVKGA